MSSAASSGRHRAPATAPALDEFNADDDRAVEVLGACLDIPEWVTTVAAGRPYTDVEALRAAGSAAAARITWDQVSGALDRHPRIGEQRAAVAGTGTESAWSRSEQSGVQASEAGRLAAGNAAYEARFGFIYLVCASGLSGAEILADLHTRLTNELPAEQPIVMDELRRIAALRLAKAVASE